MKMMKTWGINVATTCLFMSPIALFVLGRDSLQRVVLVNVCLLLLAFATPPWGWKRPHPYSDQPHLRRE